MMMFGWRSLDRMSTSCKNTHQSPSPWASPSQWQAHAPCDHTSRCCRPRSDAHSPHSPKGDPPDCREVGPRYTGTNASMPFEKARARGAPCHRRRRGQNTQWSWGVWAIRPVDAPSRLALAACQPCGCDEASSWQNGRRRWALPRLRPTACFARRTASASSAVYLSFWPFRCVPGRVQALALLARLAALARLVRLALAASAAAAFSWAQLQQGDAPQKKLQQEQGTPRENSLP